MSEDRPPRDEALDLALKLCDRELSAEEQRRLSDLLELSDDACAEYLRAAGLDADLVFLVRAEAVEARVLSVIGTPQDAPPATLATSRAFGLRRALSVAAAIAAAVLIVVAVWPDSGGEAPPPVVADGDAAPAEEMRGDDNAAPAESLAAERQPQPVATLVTLTGARDGERTLQAGQSFDDGDELSLAEGEAQVSMASGADFVLKAPAAVRFESANHVTLLRGVLTARVAEWGAGFTVDTDVMRVIDLGTQFAVAASGSDVETHVLKGQVRVQPLSARLKGRRSVLLSDGEALRLDKTHDQATRMDAQRERFPESPNEFNPFRPIAMTNTGLGLAIGDEDPNWRITRGPIGADYAGPQFGVVCVPDERYAPNEPDRSQWISLGAELRPGGMPNSVFTFETDFDLVGYDLATMSLAMQVLADNGVREIRLNGEPVDVEPWDDNVPYQEFRRNRFRLVEVNHGFVPGRNRVEIDVWNGVYQVGERESPNPVALRVEFQGFGRVAEPLTAEERR